MIDKLEQFLVLAKTRHFGRAAEALNISQPTLSAAIKQLEAQLGVRLVERGARFQRLTPEGERVLVWAQKLVGDSRAMRADLQAARGSLSGNLRLAVIPTALAMVQDVTAGFTREHPEVRVTILSRTSTDIMALLENLEADVGITYLENEPLGAVETLPLYREHYVLVTADKAYADRRAITWREAGRLPLCLLTPDMQNRRIIGRYLAADGAQVHPQIETDSIVAMVAHVMTGRWAGILPQREADLFAGAGKLHAVPLSGPDGAQLVGATAIKRSPQTPMVIAFFKVARRLSAL